ncbi:MAG: enoyl-CoA hydratase/isomerase family protein [Actinomycetia bacterium]|nr:enoyl-CoA hydratase/isomerase family protein [Actinomycetes bacterium]
MSVVLVEQDGPVGILRLNRPEVLNALNSAVMEALADQLTRWDRDPAVRVVILTGNDKAFAAGADIAEMAERTPVEMLQSAQITRWEAIRQFSKPLIAAVSGWALGGGMELAMLCDLIVASETARFGQPEIRLGVMPGAGGTQRLTKIVGKMRAMDLVLTGRHITAEEALQWGLVNRVVPVEQYWEEALKLARSLAAGPPLALALAKEAVLFSLDSTVEDGLKFERKVFALLFASEDRREGMAAFLEKRAPQFRGR